VDEHGVGVAHEGGDVIEIAHDQIERTRTVLVWGPPPRRPSPSRRAARAKTAAHTKDAGS
jgi:hypothetical protein